MTLSERIADEISHVKEKMQKELSSSEKGMIEQQARIEVNRTDCNACKGIKWISYEITDLYHENFGKCYPCPECSVNTSEQIQEIKYEQANINLSHPPLLDNFDPELQKTLRGKKAVKKAYELAKSWTNGEVVMFLCLVGGTGVGKTHLALGSAAKLVENGKGIRYMNGEQFANELRPRSFNDNEGRSQRQFRSNLMNAEYLILDEVGIATDSTGWMSNQYQEIISHRFDNNKPTFITGNIEKSPNETPDVAIERVLGSRVVSRLKDVTKSRLCSLWEANDMRPFIKTS